MGRPREHDESTRIALREAAERLVGEGGHAEFSVRAVADEAGTTTRAIYSIFGSREGLLVDALAQGAFEFLYDEIDLLEESDDAVADLIDVGPVFRRLVLEHPARYRIAFQRVGAGLRPGPELTEARSNAWNQLESKIERIGVDSLRSRTVKQAAVEFNAMLEGLANAELRGSVFPNLPVGGEEQAWRGALGTVVAGWSPTPH